MTDKPTLTQADDSSWRIQVLLRSLAFQIRAESGAAQEPRFEALCDVAAEIIDEVRTRFEDYDQRGEAIRRRIAMESYMRLSKDKVANVN